MLPPTVSAMLKLLPAAMAVMLHITEKRCTTDEQVACASVAREGTGRGRGAFTRQGGHPARMELSHCTPVVCSCSCKRSVAAHTGSLARVRRGLGG